MSEDENNELLGDWFGDNQYRELVLGERILNGDKFICNNMLFPATDTGNGIYSTDHCPHYRLDPITNKSESGKR